MWIKPDELITVEVDGLGVSFYPLKRKDRLAINVAQDDSDSSVDQVNAIYDFIIKYIKEIEGVSPKELSNFIESQTAEMAGKLFSEIMTYGMLPAESVENLNSPLESQQQDIPTAIAESAEKTDASINQNMSSLNAKERLKQG